MPSNRRLVLDTHVWVWSVEGNLKRLRPAVAREIEAAASDGRLHISAISVWEVGMLVTRGRLQLARDVGSWIAESRRPPGVRVVPLTSAVALDASTLPGRPPADPADCVIAGTARALGALLVTCDRAVLAYGASGHVLTLDARP